MNNLSMYTLAKIDVMDALPTADVFDEERYTVLRTSEDLDDLLGLAIGRFSKENPGIKSYAQWLEEAEEGGFKFSIRSETQELFRASSAIISQEVSGSISLILKHHSGRKRKGDGHP